MKKALILALFFAAARLAVSFTFGLGADEAHYVLYGRWLDIGYFDHPPLVGWVHALFITLFHEGEVVARIPAVLLGVATTLLLFRFLQRAGFSQCACMLGCMSYNAALMMNILNIMLLPDTLMLPLTLAVILTFDDVLKEGSLRNWLLFGAVIGLAGLSKYNAVLLILPVAGIVMWEKRWDIFRSRGLYLSIAVAFVAILPVLAWNMQNGFASFTYQQGHVLGATRYSLSDLSTSLGAQAATFTPFLFLMAFYGFFVMLKSSERVVRLAVLTGGVTLLFFGYAALKRPTLPHWWAAFYLLFIPLAAAHMFDCKGKKRIMAFVGAGTALVMTLAMFVIVGLKLNPFPPLKSPLWDVHGWDMVMETANGVANTRKNAAIGVNHWSLGSRAIWYGRDMHDVYVVDDRLSQFDFWQNGTPEGRDILFLDMSPMKPLKAEERFICREVQQAHEMTVALGGKPVNHVKFVWCLGFEGLRKKNSK